MGDRDKPQSHQEPSWGQKGRHRETIALQTAEHGALLRASPTSDPRREVKEKSLGHEAGRARRD